MPEPVGEKYKAMVEAVRPESKMNFRLGEVIENNLALAISQSVEGVTREEAKGWVKEAGKGYQRLLEGMSRDDEAGVRGSRWVWKLGELSGEERVLAAGCFMAASLGLDIMDKDEDSALAGFIHQAKERSIWKARFGLLTNKLVSIFRGKGGYRGAMGVGTTDERFGMIVEMTKHMVDYQRLDILPYYQQEVEYVMDSGGVRRGKVRPVGQRRSPEQTEHLEVENEWRAGWEELSSRVERGEVEKRSREYGDEVKRLNKLRPKNWGWRDVYLDEDIIWYCMGKYRVKEKSDFKIKISKLAEKVNETKGKIRKWFGIKS